MSVAERVRHEIREIGLVTLYFLACFLFFLSLKALLLDEYDIEVNVLSTAIVGALVVAKVVVILDKTPLGEWFAADRLVIHVLWRSLVYTAVVFVVTLAEHLFELYREVGELAGAFSKLRAEGSWDHLLAMNLSMAFFFIVYNVLAEIGRHLGEHGLRDLLLSHRDVDAEPSGGASDT